MNLNIFVPNEKAQALDDTFIWEEIKVIALLSDWSVKVKWVKWTWPDTVITVPENRREKGTEHWNVRKWREKETTSSSNSRPMRHARLNTGYRAFTGNPTRLARNDEVSFRIYNLCFPTI